MRRVASAASRARQKAAPTSGSTRPRITQEPSEASSTTDSSRLRWRSRSRFLASTARSVARQALTSFSIWAAVECRATATSSSSVSGVATRVRARATE